MKKLSVPLLFTCILLLLMVACSPSRTATGPATKEPYKVGFSGAMTGPGAAGQLESKEGFRIYIETLNAKGGIDGHPIQVVYEDDRAEGIKAVSNVKKFEGLGVHLIAVDSLSSVYAGVIGEVERINIPLVTYGVGLTQARPPQPHRLGFSVGHVGLPDMPPIADIKMTKTLAAGKPFKMAVLVADLPLARLSGVMMVNKGKEDGFDVLMEVAPMSTTDLTPIARKFIDAKVNYITYYGPGHLMLMLGDALLKLGYKDTFFVQVGGGSFETALVEKWNGVENFIGASVQTSPTVLNLPEHQPIKEAASKYGAAVSVDHKVVDGWLNGMVTAEIFKRAGWPVTTDKLLKVMNDFKMERAPLGPPLRWTATDHIGDRWFGFYAWRGGKIVPVVKENIVGVNTSYEILGAVSSFKDIKVK